MWTSVLTLQLDDPAVFSSLLSTVLASCKLAYTGYPTVPVTRTSTVESSTVHLRAVAIS